MDKGTENLTDLKQYTDTLSTYINNICWVAERRVYKTYFILK